MERQRIKRTWGVATAGVCLLIPGILLGDLYGRHGDSAGGYLEWHFS